MSTDGAIKADLYIEDNASAQASAQGEGASAQDLSEDSLSEQLVSENVNRLLYVPDWSKWLINNGRVWQIDNTLQIMTMTRQICRKAAQEVEAASDNSSMAKKLTSKQTVAAVEYLARADSRIAVTPDIFDQDVDIINTPDGVWNLKTAKLRDQKPQDYCMKITSCGASGECPTWHKFLNDVTNGDIAMKRYLQQIAGYILTGHVSEHALFFIYGPGRNGKSVFLNILSFIMGDYAKTASMETLAESRYQRHETELAMLQSARLVTAQETEGSRNFNESRIKTMTGGDPITARYMRKDYFTFQPQFKLTIAGNHKPGLKNVDEAIKSRIHLIPFTVTIPPEKRDKNLESKLKQEQAGILSWAIYGAKDWYENGLQIPESVKAASEEYMGEEDAVQRWLDERCDIRSGGFERKSDLYADWKGWCEVNGEYAGTQMQLIRQLKTKHPKLVEDKCTSTRRTGLQGIKIHKDLFRQSRK